MMFDDRTSDNVSRPADDAGEEYQPVELKVSLAPNSPPSLAQLLGMSADCYLIDASGSRLSGSLVTVSTKVGEVKRAVGADDAGESGSPRGAIGLARYNPRIDALQFEALQTVAELIIVTAPSNVAAGDTFTVTSCVVLDDGQDPCVGGRSITITNWPQQVCEGVVCKCIPNGSGGYLVIDADCPPDGGCS